MPIILSLAYSNQTLYASGPEGLFRLSGTELLPIAQPQSELACCAAVDSRVLVGGAPHGVAYTLADGTWQAGWMDGVAEPVYCLAPDPRVAQTGVILAGSAGGGVLRTHNRGQTWATCNYGLQEFNVLSLVWAPIAPTDAWPQWEVVLAGTENGVYRSPNGGRGWKQASGIEGVVQAIAFAPDFHKNGVVLAGTESNGLWRSLDGGRSFELITTAPSQINAVIATADRWWLSDATGLWFSTDTQQWQQHVGKPAMCMLVTAQGLFVGGEEGITSL